MKTTPTPQTLLADFISQNYAPLRKLSARTAKLYIRGARKLSNELGRDALISDLPSLARAKTLPTCDLMGLISVWRYASRFKLVKFDEQLLGALAEIEVATHRLAMMRENPAVDFDKPRPDMPLLDFVVCSYMQSSHGRRREKPSAQTFYKLRSIVRHLQKVLGRVPLVSDLTPRNATAAIDAMRLKLGRLTNVYADLWLSLWRCAAEQGLLAPEHQPPERKSFVRAANRGPDGKQIVLDESAGTLWHICVNQYFPVNTDINKPSTRKQYRCAMRDFKQHLGHEPMLADLTDDAIAGMMRAMLDRGLKPKTVNERRGRLRALWDWLAKKRMVSEFPFVKNLKCPKRIPRAWSKAELAKLFEACRNAPGEKAPGVSWADWWTALHLVLWDSGARIGEIGRLEWDWLDTETGVLIVPAEVRKASDRDMAYRLHPSTLAVLARIRALHKRFVFGEYDEQALFYQYRKLRKRAGLPLGSQNGFHKMRRTVATWLQRGGHNASDVLKHSSQSVTRDSYLDPTLLDGVHPSEVLFRPDQDEPPRLGYAG
jgi:integrase